MFEISKSKIGLTDLLKVSGRIDSINARMVHETINNEISYDDPYLVIDMADVEYMSAAGLRILRALYDVSGHVRIASPSKRVREVLQITGLDAMYEIYDSRMAAVHAIQPITNAHTRLEWGMLKDNCPTVSGQPYVDWLNQAVRDPLKELGTEPENAFQYAIDQGIKHLIDSGVTMVGDITYSSASIDPLLKSGLQGVVYVELMGTDPTNAKQRLTDVMGYIEKNRHHIQRGMHIGLSFNAPHALHPDVWQYGLDYARKHHLPVAVSVAQSPAEYEFMTKGTGAIADAYFTDMPPIASPMKTPVQYLADTGALDLKPLLIHCVQVDNDDIKLIKDSGSTVVHCPRSNLRLQCGRMPLEKFLEQDVNVLLGTDSLASTPSLSVLDEVEVAVALHHGKVDPADIVTLISNTIPIDSRVKS